MILVYRTTPGAGNISPLPCGKQAISKNVGFRGPYIDVRLILQPFLLVTLPDFKYYITNRLTVDVLCYFSLTLLHAGENEAVSTKSLF